jgi:hypothetical protein
VGGVVECGVEVGGGGWWWWWETADLRRPFFCGEREYSSDGSVRVLILCTNTMHYLLVRWCKLWDIDKVAETNEYNANFFFDVFVFSL